MAVLAARLGRTGLLGLVGVVVAGFAGTAARLAEGTARLAVAVVAGLAGRGATSWFAEGATAATPAWLAATGTAAAWLTAGTEPLGLLLAAHVVPHNPAINTATNNRFMAVSNEFVNCSSLPQVARDVNIS